MAALSAIVGLSQRQNRVDGDTLVIGAVGRAGGEAPSYWGSEAAALQAHFRALDVDGGTLGIGAVGRVAVLLPTHGLDGVDHGRFAE